MPATSSNVANHGSSGKIRSTESDCYKTLTEVFGHADYKGKQKEIVEAAYKGVDVLVVAPTGMGKSLCFQVPAVATRKGLSVVVSPLLALMQNQVEYLREKHVKVAALNSQVSYQEQQQLCTELQNYDIDIKILYVTPEKMRTADFLKLLDVIHDNHNLARFIVDEAHCISEWGHDFRGDYRLLGRFRERYPDVPIMALTATATPTVQRDIIQSLRLNEANLFQALHPFNRPNLFYEVRYLSNPDQLNQMNAIFDYITTLYRRRGKASTGVIYCRMRKTCDDLANYLRGKGLNAKPYHRGVPSATLEKTLKNWTNGAAGETGTVDVVVATIAFGLGIDKGDVRYIIHYDLPKSFEGYYQETGRAGRDGQPSKCILYYSREDMIRVKKYVHSDPNKQRDNHDDEPTPTQRASGSLDALIQFAESATICRHVSICRFFGESIDDTDGETLKAYCDGMCDVCKYPDKTKTRIRSLTAKDLAPSNVPFARTTSFSNGVPSPRDFQPGPNTREEQRSVPSRGSFNGSKRSRDVALGEPGASTNRPITAKKPKTFGPTLVTKPFGSAAGLAKPFRPPAFVSRSANADANSTPVEQRSSPKHSSEVPPLGYMRSSANGPSRSSLADPYMTRQLAGDEDEVINPDENRDENHDEDPGRNPPSSPVPLPEVDMGWEPEHSAKASYQDRTHVLSVLRASLHKTLTPMFGAEPIWAKISSGLVRDEQRGQIIFHTAKCIESNALLLSSTLQGYLDRVDSRKGDIKALMNWESWDADDPNGDFEDSQEIIQMLRVGTLEVVGENKSLASGKGKQRAW